MESYNYVKFWILFIKKRSSCEFLFSFYDSQTWADQFVTELNDTHVEAQIRNMHLVEKLPIPEVVNSFSKSRRKLIVLGFNTTCTTTPPTDYGRRFDLEAEVKVMNFLMHEYFKLYPYIFQRKR